MIRTDADSFFVLCREVSKGRPLNVGLVTNDKCITFSGKVQMTFIPLKALLLQLRPQKGMRRGGSSQREGMCGEGSRGSGNGEGCERRGAASPRKVPLPYLQTDGFFGTADLHRIFQMWYGLCTGK